MSAAALFLFLNGSLFSTWGAKHVDLSINLTAAHALRDGEVPYGPTTLLERARELRSPTELLYSQLFTSYIQPPTSALHIVPLSFLPWREATHVYLLLNHVLLFAAIGVVLATVRPTLPPRRAIAIAAVTIALFSQIYGSFTLGQVDATICLLLAVGFWASLRGHAAITGSVLAAGAAIKLLPGLLLLYFLWKRDFRTVAWGAGVGLALFLLSLAAVGSDVYRAYIDETLPALSKGSSQYSNMSLVAVIVRLNSPEVVRGQPQVEYLDEAPGGSSARIASSAVVLAGLGALVLVTAAPLAPGLRRALLRLNGNGDAARSRAGPFLNAEATDLRRRFWEYYFVVAVGLLISSVTWEFYSIWLLPAFLAVFLAPHRLLPEGRLRPVLLALLALLLLALNLPGDLYLFGPNDFFFHPEWVPGQWLEDRIRLYHNHMDAVILLRLPALLLFAGSLALLVLHTRSLQATRAYAESAPFAVEGERALHAMD